MRILLGLLVATTALAEPPATPTVTLLEPGAAPHAALRYAPRGKSEADGTLSLSLKTTQDVAGRASEVVLPDVTFEVALKTLPEKSDALHFQLTLNKVRIPAEPDAQKGTSRAMRRSWRALERGRAILRATRRGIPSSAKLKLKNKPPEALSEALPTLVQAIRDILVRFPEEPVGVGGRWTVAESVTTGGVTYARSTTWTLEAVTDGVLTLAMTRTETAPAGEAVDGLPADMKATITAVGGSATGRAVIRPSSLLPLSFDVKASHRLEIKGQSGKKPFRMTSGADSRIRIARDIE